MRYHGHFQDSPTGGVKLNMGKRPKIATFHPLIHHHFPRRDNCMQLPCVGYIIFRQPSDEATSLQDL